MLTPKQAKEEYLKNQLKLEERRKKNLPDMVQIHLDELILDGESYTRRSDIADEFCKLGFKVKTTRNWYFKKTGYTIVID